MRREDVPAEIERLAFDFFYWFSRFEFALKEKSEFRKRGNSDQAEPDWNQFIKEFKTGYIPSNHAKALIRADPERQIIDDNGDLSWRPVSRNGMSELDLVVTLLKTVRNNLFHGGKQGAGGWDNNDRNRQLLELGSAVLRVRPETL